MHSGSAWILELFWFITWNASLAFETKRHKAGQLYKAKSEADYTFFKDFLSTGCVSHLELLHAKIKVQLVAVYLNNLFFVCFWFSQQG